MSTWLDQVSRYLVKHYSECFHEVFFFFFSGEGEIKAGEKATTENEMVGWHHRLNGHEFEQAPGIGNGQEGLVCCRPWGRRVGHD